MHLTHLLLPVSLLFSLKTVISSPTPAPEDPQLDLPRLDLHANVVRGLTRAWATHPNALLYEVTVAPRKNDPPAKATLLTANLRLAMRDAPSPPPPPAPPTDPPMPGQFFLISASRTVWGEWNDPGAGRPSSDDLDPFEWEGMGLGVEEAAEKIKGEGWTSGWSHVVVRKSRWRGEVEYSFWQLRHWIEREYPVEVLVGAVSGRVTAVYTRPGEEGEGVDGGGGEQEGWNVA